MDFNALLGGGARRQDYEGVEFWHSPERAGWLMKQGEYIKTWRRRWFVLKSGKILWFKTDADAARPDAQPRGCVDVRRCLSIKGAEDALNKPCAFEVSTSDGESMFFVADSDKDKEDWINAVGRAIVRHSRALLDHDVQDYTTAGAGQGGG